MEVHLLREQGSVGSNPTVAITVLPTMKVIQPPRTLTNSDQYDPACWVYLGSIFDGKVELLLALDDDTIYTVWEDDCWWVTTTDKNGKLAWDTIRYHLAAEDANLAWDEEDATALTSLKNAVWDYCHTRGFQHLVPATRWSKTTYE